MSSRADLVIVTGGATGIGLAIVEELLDQGHAVVIGDVDTEAGAKVADRLPVEFQRLDVSSEEDWRALSQRFAEDRVIGLVNNAGVSDAGTVTDETLEHWTRTIAVNQTGVFLGMREFGPLMAAAGGGSIVNMASILSAGGGFGNGIAYHASKGAVAAMTKNAAVHWAMQKVRVNSVHPGFVATPMGMEHLDLPIGDSTLGELVRSGTPMGRLGETTEIAPLVEFLLSSRASYLTGGEYFADGGWNAH